jgi:hypothetical protein
VLVPDKPVPTMTHTYPNPFNPETTISFAVKSRGTVRLAIYGVTGQLVRTLVDETLAEGPIRAFGTAVMMRGGRCPAAYISTSL